MPTPLISVCIPVYNTEPVLRRCLDSVVGQTFGNFEIVILNDCSPGQDNEGNDCKKIVKAFNKQLKKNHRKNHVEYLEHDTNKGIVVTRKDLVYAAHGEYIFMLDSDDYLPPDALQMLAEQIQGQNEAPDIIQGNAQTFELDQEGQPHFPGKIRGTISYEKITGHNIFTAAFMEHKISCFLWAKLIRREVFLDALEFIPDVYCILAEDFLISFFITRLAVSYIGIDHTVYNYCTSSGISSKVIITSIERWEQCCSVASVFTTIFSWEQEQKELTGTSPLSAEEIKAITGYAVGYLKNNLEQLRRAVHPDIRDQAHKILEDFWGESFVKRIENEVDNSL
ncbi:MAG: glycosyltransferase family 2 protein [Treponema sp.]|nr:glycosyltransferase family 2 protein [Treponema sp.]